MRELMRMMVETRDWGYQRRWSPWGIDDCLIMLLIHMPIPQKANHLRGYPKPYRLGVEHPVPNAQLHNKSQKRSEDTRGQN